MLATRVGLRCFGVRLFPDRVHALGFGDALNLANRRRDHPIPSL